MKRMLVLGAMLMACGSSPPPEAQSVKRPPAESRPPALVESPPEARPTLELVTIPVAWVKKTMPAAATDVKTWSDVHDNAVTVGSTVHAVWTTGADAKAKMDKRLARLAKKEDVAKIEKDNDPGLPEDDIKKTAATLAPGEATKDPVKLEGGLLWVKKDVATEDQLGSAYKAARAPDLAKKLAEEIAAKLKSAETSRAAIADAVTAVLGENASADAARPQAMTVDEIRIKALRVPEETKTTLAQFVKTARAGQVIEPPLAMPGAFLVARSATPGR